MAEGHRAVFIGVAPTPDGNPLEIVKAVNDLLPGIQRVAPPGLKVFNQFDVAHFVNASIDEVTHTLIEAILIVVVVIFLFLGSLRAVLIPVVTIRSEEHTSELQSLMRISYAVFCLKKTHNTPTHIQHDTCTPTPIPATTTTPT